jgi:HSP20 family protein
MPERDLFANFERMRREMDQLFGDWPGRGLVGTRTVGFSPKVDLYYCGSHPSDGAGTSQLAVVKVDLSGVELSDVTIEVSGRELVISGERPVQETEGRVYQQLEIEHGPFRRTVTLGVDVRAEDARAVYENGMLRVELPLAEPSSHARTVPIEVAEERPE